MEGRTIWWEEGGVGLIDQTLLPGRYEHVVCTTVRRLVVAIQRLEVRGAPALGVAGAYGIALACSMALQESPDTFHQSVQQDAAALRSARPTAVNLAWGVDQVLAAVMEEDNPAAAAHLALRLAEALADEDEAICRLIGSHGAGIIPDGATVLTHCNAGALACSAWGTALGVIRSAVADGKDVSVISCETRPLLQGSRLTAWELARDAIPVTTIIDSQAAYLMQKGEVDLIIVGADRICRDGLFNKIGTYMHAVTARYHQIPFYVAAPKSTFDPSRSVLDVIVEERERDEVAAFCGVRTVPDDVPVRNYAFDATPFDLVSGIITEEGIITRPYEHPWLVP
ncbi:methylthioribose-1-phosphate isomerase [Methanocalculus chunghsingensis]|uniref:Putative methylthioribose-1-phosphate isomerase n=1 Tax=Methanocalculus chunghsingensis TaxID=156457 RepID=A0A8J7W5V0_9EURY|nr:S-methyl-5-thioribose-1-phosphate isomerase [Methanocalculus chunghsingensis]MBR1368914.1 methylthioribose-1-phosphate isomerase [Methanocalculus chunghsingensis]